MVSLSGNRFKFWPFCLIGCLMGTVVSQTVLDICTTLMFGHMVYDYFKAPENFKKIKWIGIEWAFGLYFLVVLLGFYFNAAPDADIKNSLLKFSWVINLYIYIYAFSRLAVVPRQVIYFFSLAFLLPNIYGLVTYFVGFDFMTQNYTHRIIGLVNSATYHAHAGAVLLVFMAAVLWHWRSQVSQRFLIFSVLSLIVFALSVFLTHTRGIWLSVFFSSIFCLGFINRKVMFGFIILAFIVVAGAYVFSPRFKERIHQTNVEQNSERINLLKLNVEIWREYPLLGIGYGENLRRNREYWDKPHWNMPEDYITSHAHNQFLNVLSTTGVFGLFFFCVFFFYFIRLNWRLFKSLSREESGSVKFVLAFACLWAQLEFFLACLTDVSFEYAKIRALLIFVWALVVNLKYDGLQTDSENRVR